MVQRTLKPETKQTVRQSLQGIVGNFLDIRRSVRESFPRTDDFQTVYPILKRGDLLMYCNCNHEHMVSIYTAADGKKYEIRVSEVNDAGASGSDLPGNPVGA